MYIPAKSSISFRRRKGSTLAFLLVILTVVTILLTSLVGYVASQVKFSLYKERQQEALHIAEAGIYFYRWYLAHELEGKTSQQVKDFWEGSPYGVGAPYEREYKDPQGSAIGKFSISVVPPQPYSTIVWVESTGWTYRYPDHKRTIRVRMRRPSWSEYMILTNDRMRLSSQTEIFGSFHANGGVHFDGVAHNTVTSSVEEYLDTDYDVYGWHPGVWTQWSNEYNQTLGSKVFLGGKSFPVDEKDFSGITADLSLMREAAQQSGTYFDSSGKGRHIILHEDGTFSIRKVRSFNNFLNQIVRYKGSWKTYTIPDNGVIYVEDNIWLEGKIDGKRVTIVAANITNGTRPDVYIQHDILYSNYDGTDTIGVVAEGDIEFIANSENNLRVDAALLAQHGWVGREFYGCNHTWSHPWCVKDEITIYGAIVSNKRFGFGYTNGTGYQDRYLYYDNNLLYTPPPYFPTGTNYAIDLWEEL